MFKYKDLRTLALNLKAAADEAASVEGAGPVRLGILVELPTSKVHPMEVCEAVPTPPDVELALSRVFEVGDFFQAFLELTKPKGEIDKLTPEEIAEGDRVGTEIANKARAEAAASKDHPATEVPFK